MTKRTKSQLDVERKEAKRLGILPQFRRRRELEKALGRAYRDGAFEFLDLCIAQNELNVAWDQILNEALRTKPPARRRRRTARRAA